MNHFKIMTRNTLFTTIIFIYFLFTPIIAAAKHIIVIYDVSGSMVSLQIGGETNVYMQSNDIRRVNEYLTNLLFTDISQHLRDIANDTYIRECDAALVGKPLYQSGDILTYVEYAKRGDIKIKREQVSKNHFQQELPNPMNLNRAFYGLVSYLLRAEVEVYDKLYRETDDETYWIFVTDGDIDYSGRNDPEIADVLKRLAEIEDEFYDPMIFGVFVNNHVRIEVRRLQKRGNIDSIFIATPTKPKESVQRIQLSRDEEGKFFSETLLINTENSEESKFKLNNVNVEIVDQNNRPLQVMNEDNILGILNVDSVELHGRPPPNEFRLLLPNNREIAALDNKIKLEVAYIFNEEDKVYSAPLMNYTPVIKSIYVARLASPDSPAKMLELQFADDKYSESLTIQTESPNVDAFQIEQIRCQVQYKDARKLCDVTVPKVIERLGEPFTIEVPKQGRLDWYGNQVMLEIDYKYENETLNTTIEIPYELMGAALVFPMWVLWVLLVPVLGLILFLVISRILKRTPIEHHITLTQIGEAGTPLGEKTFFILNNETTLEFGPEGPEELRFDVGSDAFIHCAKKNLILFENPDDEEGHILDLPETLILSRGQDEDDISVLCEIADDGVQVQDDGNPIIESNTTDANPIDV